MTINKEKLIELLVEKTGFEKEQVERQLSELIKRIREVASEGKNFEIENFGIFSPHDDKLQFTPSNELKTEINNKYAGMEPIELVGSYQETELEKPTVVPEEEEQEQVSDEPASAIDEESSSDQSTEEIPVADEAVGTEPTAEEEEDDVSGVTDLPPSSFALDEGPGPEQPEEKSEEEEEVPWDEDDEEKGTPEFETQQISDEEPEEIPGTPREIEEEKKEPVVAEETVEKTMEEEEVERKAKWRPAPELQDTGARTSPEEEGDMIGNILIILVIIIATGVGVWFVYDLGLFSGSTGQQRNNAGNQQSEQQIEPRQNDPPAAQMDESDEQQADSEPSESGDDGGTPSEEQPSEPVEQNEVAKNETGQATYGLRGEPVAEANSGYTIVVHSIKSVTKARDIREQLKTEGYRTVLTDAIVGEQRYWRIGLGQFETVGDAQDAADELEEPFRSNFFIKRIES